MKLIGVSIINAVKHFDNAARNWDKDSKHLDRAKATFDVIQKNVPISAEARCLDFGCGTGLLGIHFCGCAGKVDFFDNSEEMRAVLKEKLAESAYGNARVVEPEAFIESEKNQYDLIVALMVMHHIVDVDLQIETFSRLLTPSGYLCIADLENEDGSFHSHIDGYNGHNGFDPAKLSELCLAHGLETVHTETYFTVEKSEKKYPLFILILRKTKNLN